MSCFFFAVSRVIFFAVNVCNKKSSRGVILFVVNACTIVKMWKFFCCICVFKKSSSRAIFFCSNACDGLTRLDAKTKLHDMTIFLLHTFTAKKKLHNLQHTQSCGIGKRSFFQLS